MKKALSTQSLRAFYPTWSDIRTSWQSVGTQLLNVFGAQFDDMNIYLEKMKRNAFLTSVNLDEVDWVYKVELPTTFSFTLDTTDQLQSVYSPPTVRGLVINNVHSGYVDVSIADENTLENMWYKSIPSRVDLQDEQTGSDILLHWPAPSFPYSGLLTHHISDGGKLYIETTSGTQYVSINDDGELDRGKITLTGTTRKGTKETETLVFPWDMKQSTSKEWKNITYVDTENLEDDVSIEIRSANFDWGPYLSFYNMRWSDIDTKIDEFWNIESIDTGTALSLVGYITDEWQNLVLGFSGKTTKDRWELINTDLSSIDAIDLAVQPFSERAWLVDDSSLYCFSLEETMVSGVDFLVDKTPDSNFKIELSNDYYTIGDDIVFTPLHIRPLKQVDRYRLWYKAPSGTKYGLNAGIQVAFSSDFWQYPTELKRELEGEVTINASERGEYKICLEVYYPGDILYIEKIVVPIKYKQPLSKIDISDYVSGVILGVDFDSDQQLWVKTDSGYFNFSLHSDLMIVDYSDKIVYLKEDYEEVDIT
jgi:hypothetical protein